MDVTGRAGIAFEHNSGAFGGKYLPETLGPGCAFLDYDNDGWQDILLVNGMDWPGHKRARTTMRLYRNNRDGTFTDVTRRAGLDVEMYGMGVAVGDYDNDGFPDLFITCAGQSRLFHNTGKGSFVDVTKKSGLGGHEGLSTSALWFDYNRDGLLDLFVCNYVKWSAADDVYCTLDGKTKSYCTPEAYRGSTCWLFRNRGDGTFEDVTAKSGIFDTSSKSLGVAMLDYDSDGWPDLFVANDTQPNKLYRNLRNGTLRRRGDSRGRGFQRRRQGARRHGSRRRRLRQLRHAGAGRDEFRQRDDGALPARPRRSLRRSGAGIERGQRISRRSLGFGCFFFDVDLDGRLDLLVVNGHIDDTVRNLHRDIRYDQPPHLFLNRGKAGFRRCRPRGGRRIRRPEGRARRGVRRLR